MLGRWIRETGEVIQQASTEDMGAMQASALAVQHGRRHGNTFILLCMPTSSLVNNPTNVGDGRYALTQRKRLNEPNHLMEVSSNDFNTKTDVTFHKP